jgi:hypothetical protein
MGALPLLLQLPEVLFVMILLAKPISCCLGGKCSKALLLPLLPCCLHCCCTPLPACPCYQMLAMSKTTLLRRRCSHHAARVLWAAPAATGAAI